MRRYMVTMAESIAISYETVEADYVEVENGCLVFCRHVDDEKGKDDVIQAFAKGAWARVEEIESRNEEKKETRDEARA